jgi:uncharacterized membrane protein YadS
MVMACGFATALLVGRTDVLPPDLATLAAISTVGGAAVVALALVEKERHADRAGADGGI